MSETVENENPGVPPIGQLYGLVDKVLAAAQPGSVYSAPVVVGDHTVITASEVAGGGGFGSGWGRGVTKADKNTAQAGDRLPEQSMGGGMGGGGGALSRPVATIIIGPDGVKVKPVIDVTKIAVAAISAWATMMVMILKAHKK